MTNLSKNLNREKRKKLIKLFWTHWFPKTELRPIWEWWQSFGYFSKRAIPGHSPSDEVTKKEAFELMNKQKISAKNLNKSMRKYELKDLHKDLMKDPKFRFWYYITRPYYFIRKILRKIK